MPTEAIVEITTQILSTDPPRDWIVNHLTFETGATTVADADFQELCDAIKGVHFATSGTFAHYGTYGGKVVAYNRADAKPRPERGLSMYTPSSWNTTDNFPRQLAICCSFYAIRNLPRQRGRVYLPLWQSLGLISTVGNSSRDQVVHWGKAINDAAGALSPSWDHTVYSSRDNTSRVVTNYWVNDVWDIQRRRAPKEKLRDNLAA